MSGLRKYGAGVVDVTGALPPPEADPVGVRTALLAHELGHATDFERRRLPALRPAIERGMWLGGKGASLLAELRGRPGMAAIGELLADAPEMFSEGVASLRGYKALKASGKYTPEELSKMKNTLISAGATYAAPPIINAGFAAFGAHHQDPSLVIPSLLGRMFTRRAVGMGLGGLFDHTAKKGPLSDLPEAEKLRQQMGVKGKLYEGVPEFGSNAAYIVPGQDQAWDKEDREKGIGSLLANDPSKKVIQTVLRDGGIVIPFVSPKEKGAEAKDKKPSLVKRIAKGLGLGAATLGTAGGLIAASDPEAVKKTYTTIKGWRISKGTARELANALGSALHFKKSGSVTSPSCETLSKTHWPALANALVK